jgi:hypothetical protein
MLMIYVRLVDAFFGCSRQKSGAETGGCNVDQLISNSESIAGHKRPGRIL